MNRLFCLALCLMSAATTVQADPKERTRWQSEARNTVVVRDNWGVPHVYGKSDADAVFGSLYAQAEDDFARIEHNYLIGLGSLAQSEGEAAVYDDLRQRLFVRPEHLKHLYRSAPTWLQELMVAWADGLNFYLSRHPDTQPKVIHHFEPWMALSFTEGSIGGDIETVDLAKLRDFYGGTAPGDVSYASAQASTEPSPGFGQPEARGLPRLHVDQGREPARCPRRRGAEGSARRHVGWFDRCRIRRSSHGLRCASSAITESL
jgi:acyl-homoserine-lactone acylase